jgi:regulator of protease activity HflC (stomatin/prohibitin superfamily)
VSPTQGTGYSSGSAWPSAVATAFLAITLMLLGAAYSQVWVVPPLVLAGAFLVAIAGFASAAFLVEARRRGPPTPKVLEPPADASLPAGYRLWHALRARALAVATSIDWKGDWLALLVTPAACVVAALTLRGAWNAAGAAALGPAPRVWVAGVLLAGAFPVLVLERHFAGMSPQILPEAAMLARLCRVPLLAVLGLAAAAALHSLGLEWPVLMIERSLIVITALVALELTLRSAVYLFIPLPPLALRRSQSDSSIAGLIQLRPPDLSLWSETIHRELGIDLARSWALQFVRRAAVPMLLALALCAWLVTGVTALGLGERAVYEVLGRPVAVLHEGLHLHLPWPLGILRRVEFGRVREIPMLFTATAEGLHPEPARTEELPAAADMESEPPSSADRLWDASHPSEASYLVASAANGQQNFQVVNIDLRVLYRIGLSDEAAREALYNIESPESMISTAAGQMLARYFARYTIMDVLGQNREAFVRGFQQELQSRLSALATGIEIMGVVVEAIHPPADAASAYQGVQAAAIRSVAQIANAKADAARTLGLAQMDATGERNEAAAAAAERVDQATTEGVLFDSDRQAYQAGGAAFLLERRIARLTKALTGTSLIIIDHRIGNPLLDLRASEPGATPGADVD